MEALTDIRKSNAVNTPPPQGHLVSIIVYLFAALVILFTFALVVVWIIRRRRNSRKHLITVKYNTFFMTLRRPTPFSIVRVTRQLSDPISRKSNIPCHAVDFISEKPQFRCTEPAKPLTDFVCSSNTDKMTNYHSFDTGSRVNNSNKKVLERSKSLAALSTSSNELEADISIAYTLRYMKDKRQFNLKLLNVFDLPAKCFGYDIWAVVYLFPRHKEGIWSRSVSGSKETELQETFLFDDMTLQEVEKCTVRFVLQYKRKSSKECFLGEMYLNCCDVDWTGDQPLTFESSLIRKKDKNVTREKYLFGDLGLLYVCLEYQSTANRMKVMVRKAADLPKSDKLFGRPSHYVFVTFSKSEKLLKTLETKVQSGYNPVWNQPFLFDLSGNGINDYILEFVIMRRKIHTKDAVVGHVTIGHNGCQSGKRHWKDITSQRPIETGKWHSIVPLIKSSKMPIEE